MTLITLKGIEEWKMITLITHIFDGKVQKLFI